jgi:hypothetical protein
MRRGFIVGLVVLATACLILGCGHKTTQVAELASFPVDDLRGILTRSNVSLDSTHSYDGNGSVRFEADRPTVIRLFEIIDVNVENARLTYQAKVRTEAFQGEAYLEMWCAFDGRGEYFARDLETPLSGSTEWSTEETYFFLQRGENPDRVRLNLVVNGTGTVWVDDIRLKQGPLN